MGFAWYGLGALSGFFCGFGHWYIDTSMISKFRHMVVDGSRLRFILLIEWGGYFGDSR